MKFRIRMCFFLNLSMFFSTSLYLPASLPRDFAGKIHSHTLQEVQKSEWVSLLYGSISFGYIRSLSSSSRSMIRDMYLRANLIDRQSSSSNLRISFCGNISYTSHRFRTKITYDGPSRECYARNYRHRLPADYSSSLQLNGGKGLEVQVERGNDELLVLVSTRNTSVDLHLGWLRGVWGQHQRWYPLRNM